MTAPRPERWKLEDLLRGAILGLGQTGTAITRGVGALPGLHGLQRWSDLTEEEMRSFYDPQGTAGKIGSVAGRVLGEGASTVAGGGLATKALGKVLPKAAAGLTKLQGAEKLGKRVLGYTLPVAPIDAALGAGSDPAHPLRGAAVNVGLDAVGAGVFGGGPKRVKSGAVASTPEAAKVMAGAPPAPATAPLLTKAGRLKQKLGDDVLALEALAKRLDAPEVIDRARVARGYLGQTDLALGRFGEDAAGITLQEARMAAQGIEPDVQAFMRAKRALGLEQAGKGWKLHATPDEARAVVADLGQRPEVVAAAGKLDDFYKRLVEKRYEAGLLSDAQFQAIAESGDYYVPFVRDFGEDAVSGLRTRGGKGFMAGSGVRKMKQGRASAPIVDAYEQAVLDAQHTMRDVGRSNVMRTLDAAVQRNPDVARDFLELVPAGTEARPGANVIHAMVNGESKAYRVKDPDLYEALASVAPPMQGLAAKLLSVPKAVLQAGVTFMPSFGVANATRDAFFTAGQFAAPLKSTLAGTAIGAGVGAAVSPEQRGKGALIGAGFGMGAGAMLPQVTRIAAATSHIIGEDDLYKQWLREGGAGMGFFSTSRKDAARILTQLDTEGAALGDVLRTRDPKEALRWVTEIAAHPVEAIKRLNEVIEQAPRVAKFAAEVKGGATPLRAAAASRDVSVDFARRGADPMVRLAGSSKAFWNPKIQGLDKVGRALNPMTPAGRKAIAVGVASMTAPSVALFALNKDNPDYWETPLWQRNFAWMIPAGKMEDGKTRFIKIPKPFEPGMVFASAPERFLEWLHQKDPERSSAALKDMLSQVGDGWLPLPTAAQPLAEVALNKDFFQGRPIVNPQLSRLPKPSQYDQRTSALAVATGEMTGQSPKMIDKLVRGYGGTTADVLNKQVLTPLAKATGIDPRPQQANPTESDRSRFIAGYGGSNSESVQAVYRRLRAAEPHLNEINRLIKAGDKAGAQAYYQQHGAQAEEARQLRRYADLLSEVALLRKRVENDRTLSSDEKSKAIAALDQKAMRYGRAATTPK